MASSNHFEKDHDYVEYVNTCVNNFLINHRNDYVPLGPEYSSFSLSEATAHLQLHRGFKKFEIPRESAIDKRDAAIADMLQYDSSGLQDFTPALIKDLDGGVRHTLYNARRLLREAISDYSFSVSSLELTNGETFVSARGDTSPYAKLRDIKQWCVTADCVPLATRLIYNSPMLRHAAKIHIFRCFKRRLRRSAHIASLITSGRATVQSLWEDWNNVLFEQVSNSNPGAKGNQLKYMVFCEKLKGILTIVPGARLTSVPKNVETDRVIECECWLNMLVQRCIAKSIIKCIKKHFDIDLPNAQELHKMLISDLSNVTIDFKNASNSVWHVVIDWFLSGTILGTHLNQARCGLVCTPEGVWHRLNMLSPMGNGFTFEVMTLLLLSIGRSLDSFAHVFGDDVIIDSDVAAVFLETVKTIGFQINETKTFLSGNFRESCGAFYCEGYITSYDLHYAEDIVDAIITVNKIGIMAHATDSDLTEDWLKLHKGLLSKAPLALLRGFDFTLLTCNGVINTHVPDLADGLLANPKWVRNKRKGSRAWIDRHKNLLIDHMDLILDLNYRPSQFHVYRYVSKRSIAYEDSSLWRKHVEDPQGVTRLLGWYYIWAGRRISPTIRGTIIQSDWRICFDEIKPKGI